MVHANTKRQNYKTSVKNVILMSAKTISSNAISVVNWKGNKLYHTFAMKVGFSSLYLIFRVFFFSSILFCLFKIIYNRKTYFLNYNLHDKTKNKKTFLPPTFGLSGYWKTNSFCLILHLNSTSLIPPHSFPPPSPRIKGWIW